MLAYVRTDPPQGELIPLDLAKRHLGVELDDGDHDVLIEAAIAAAMEHLDGRAGDLGRALLTQEWQAFAERPTCLDGTLVGFALDLGPIQAVTGVDRLVNGSYVPLPGGWRARALPDARTAVLPTLGSPWPADADRDPAAWRLTFTAGYGDAADAVPAPIRAAALLLLSDLFENRDGKVNANLVANPTVERLLAPYRRIGL